MIKLRGFLENHIPAVLPHHEARGAGLGCPETVWQVGDSDILYSEENMNSDVLPGLPMGPEGR